MDSTQRLELTAPSDCPELDGDGPQQAAVFQAREDEPAREQKLSLLLPRNDVMERARKTADRRLLGIYQTKVPGRGAVPMLRTMMTTVCDKACGYCPFGRTRDFKRSSWKPEQLADTVIQLKDAGLIQGFFLTSGLATNASRIMDRMLATAEILRQRGYAEYLHLKLLPGADSGQVAQAMRLANRVSVNLEAPTQNALHVMAPEKDLVRDLAVHVKTVSDLSRRFPEHAPKGGLVTQFVVGPAGETDATLLGAASRLYGNHGVRRVYFSGFIPIMGTPMQESAPTNPMREARLYQADWLLRFYGFKLGDLALNDNGNLPTDIDPKTAFAMAHPELFPLEVNKAPRELLLRVPGIGPQSVTRILHARRASGDGRRIQPARGGTYV